MHVKWELLDELIDSSAFNVIFAGNPNPSIYWRIAYTDDPNNIAWNPYDSVFLESPATGVSLVSRIRPEIDYTLTDFSQPKHAGANDTLTIYGRGFGNQRGKIHFTRGDKGGKLSDGSIDWLKGLDNQYYGDWTNEEIKIIVPSYVKNGYIDTSDYNITLTDYGSGAGTGKIYIKTAYNDSVISTNNLKIDYSVTNRSYHPLESYPIKRVYLARQDCKNDFVFTLHSSIQNHVNRTDIINAIEAAIAKWRTVVPNIDIVINKNSLGQYVYSSYTSNPSPPYQFDNNLNVIGFTTVQPNGSPLSGMGVPYRFNHGFSTENDTVFYRTKGSHIYIQQNPTVPYSYQTSGTVSAGTVSFYNGILHELGHILLLEHVIDSTNLMWYSIDPNNPQPIFNLTPTNPNVVAVTETRDLSQNIRWQGNLVTTLGNTLPIRVPIKINANPSSGVVCNGEPVTLSVPGSSSFHNFLWSNGNTNATNVVTSEGSYAVTLSTGLNNCSLTSSAYNVVTSTLTATYNAIPPTVVGQCSGGKMAQGSITANVTSDPSSPVPTYLWSTGQTSQSINVNFSSYTLTITNSKGCKISDIFNFQSPIIHEMIGTVTVVNCLATANVVVGVSPYTYQWYKNGTAIPGATTPTLSVLCPHTYKVVVTDACGNTLSKDVPCCSSKNSPLSDDYENFQQEISIYPNPTTGTFRISNIEQAEIQIFSMLGNLLYQQNNVTEDSEINLEKLASGVYVVKVIEENDIMYLRLIIEK
jgi:hypothetical protein